MLLLCAWQTFRASPPRLPGRASQRTPELCQFRQRTAPPGGGPPPSARAGYPTAGVRGRGRRTPVSPMARPPRAAGSCCPCPPPSHPPPPRPPPTGTAASVISSPPASWRARGRRSRRTVAGRKPCPRSRRHARASVPLRGEHAAVSRGPTPPRASVHDARRSPRAAQAPPSPPAPAAVGPRTPGAPRRRPRPSGAARTPRASRARSPRPPPSRRGRRCASSGRSSPSSYSSGR